MGLFEELAAGSSKWINSAGQTVNLLDSVTNGQRVITDDQSQIHDGVFFSLNAQATLTSGGTYNIVFTTSSSKTVHFRFLGTSCSADKLNTALYENCSVSSGATATSYNHNRNNTAIATMTIAKTANVTADGTLLTQSYIGGGTATGGHFSGGELGEANEWVLNPSINYCMRITNNSSGSNTFNTNVGWYEEDA